MEKEITY